MFSMSILAQFIVFCGGRLAPDLVVEVAALHPTIRSDEITTIIFLPLFMV
jgi:hypothetical protein